MAPEQAQGKQLDRTADVYSLGSILYELLTGRTPFQADTPAAVYEKIFKEEPPPPSSLGFHVDGDLETICLKCLEKEPPRRYQTAQALADDLERWLANKPIEARRAGLPHRFVKWLKREPTLASVCLGLTLVIAAGLGIAFRLWHPPHEKVTFDFSTGKVIATGTVAWQTNACDFGEDGYEHTNARHIEMRRGSQLGFTFQINHPAIREAKITILHLSSAHDYTDVSGETRVLLVVNGHPCGQLEPGYPSFLAEERSFPAGYLHEGANDITLQYEDTGNTNSTAYWIKSLQLRVW
jgi:hypothetical protein